MQKLLLAILGVLVAIWFPKARADGNGLLAECNLVVRAMDNGEMPSTRDGLKVGKCLGLVQGITNLNMVYQVTDRGSALFCLPDDGINNGQAARIVVKYMKENPSELHKEDSLIAIAAFIDAYPFTDGL